MQTPLERMMKIDFDEIMPRSNLRLFSTKDISMGYRRYRDTYFYVYRAASLLFGPLPGL